MSTLMEQLHDIEGIDSISPWPLAVGWWVCIACGVILLLIAMWALRRRLRYLRSWQRQARKTLKKLQRELSPSTSVQTVVFLSEYLRRIAMHQFPRKDCAGLVGKAWLEWLKTHDPQQFDWTAKGKWLLETPYAPHAEAPHVEAPHADELSTEQVQELIKATKHWVY